MYLSKQPEVHRQAGRNWEIPQQLTIRQIRTAFDELIAPKLPDAK